MVHPRVKQAIDWAFAITAFFASLFLIALVGGVVSGADISLRLGGYFYTGPIYRCLPVMAVGLFAVGGTVLYLVLSFLEGRSGTEHDAEGREIEGLSGSSRFAEETKISESMD